MQFLRVDAKVSSTSFFRFRKSSVVGLSANLTPLLRRVVFVGETALGAGALGECRTPDLRVRSAMLYRALEFQFPAFGFHSRARRWASAIWSGVILAAIPSRSKAASPVSGCAAADKFHHMYART